MPNVLDAYVFKCTEEMQTQPINFPVDWKSKFLPTFYLFNVLEFFRSENFTSIFVAANNFLI